MRLLQLRLRDLRLQASTIEYHVPVVELEYTQSLNLCA